MRARSGLTRRSERLESIGVPLSSRRLLDLQCSGPDAPIVTPYRSPPRRLRTGGDARPSRESGFAPCPEADSHDLGRNGRSGGELSFVETGDNGKVAPIPARSRSTKRACPVAPREPH